MGRRKKVDAAVADAEEKEEVVEAKKAKLTSGGVNLKIEHWYVWAL